MSLKYEPPSEPPHTSAKKLFLNRGADRVVVGEDDVRHGWVVSVPSRDHCHLLRDLRFRFAVFGLRFGGEGFRVSEFRGLGFKGSVGWGFRVQGG